MKSQDGPAPSPTPRTAGPGQRLFSLLLGTGLGRVALSASAGTLLFLACADFDIWPLCWIGMLPLLHVLLDREGLPRVRRPFFYGFVCGLLANGGGFYWIVGLLQRFGHLPFIAAAPIFGLLIAYQALTFGIFASLLCRLRAQIDVPVTWLAPLCWTACELCVPYVFPWYLAITQAWVPPVIQIADITGPLGVSFLLVLCNGALFDLLCLISVRRKDRAKVTVPGESPGARGLGPPLTAAVTIALCLVYGVVRIHQVQARRQAADKVKVGVVQANIGIHEKFVPGLGAQQLALHQQLSADLSRRGAELIVWPESSYPYALPRPLVHDPPENSPYRVRRGFETPLLFGALTVDRSGPRPVPYNTALMMDQAGDITATFDKNFLLVFGEYIPFYEQMRWLEALIPAMSNFARGHETRTFPLTLHGQRYSIGPMICYEDIIPAFSRRLFDSPTPPHLLVNITNDAWFGATSEPWEHMALSVYRAVEHRVDLVRAVNTGVSVFIDATGKVYDKGPSVDPLLTPGVAPVTLLNQAALLQEGGLYQRLGETFGGLCLALVLAMGVLARWRAGRGVRWTWLILGAMALHGWVLLLALIIPGPVDSTLRATYAALAHRNEHDLPGALLFSATVWLTLGLALASGVLGAVLARLGLREQQLLHQPTPGGIPPGRLEAIWAIVLVTVAPVICFGRMEGNTGAVVLLTLLCAGASLLCGRLSRLLSRTPLTPPPPAEDQQPTG